MIHGVIYQTTYESRRSLIELWNPTIHLAETSHAIYTITDEYHNFTKQSDYSNFEFLKLFTSIRDLDIHVSKLALRISILSYIVTDLHCDIVQI